MREVLITSHSPFIISDCQQENVLIFKKGADKIVGQCAGRGVMFDAIWRDAKGTAAITADPESILAITKNVADGHTLELWEQIRRGMLLANCIDL